MRRMSLALLSFQMPQVYVVLSEEIRQATQREKDINWQCLKDTEEFM